MRSDAQWPKTGKLMELEKKRVAQRWEVEVKLRLANVKRVAGCRGVSSCCARHGVLAAVDPRADRLDAVLVQGS